MVAPHRMKRPWNGAQEPPFDFASIPQHDPSNPLSPGVGCPASSSRGVTWPPVDSRLSGGEMWGSCDGGARVGSMTPLLTDRRSPVADLFSTFSTLAVTPLLTHRR